MRWNCYRDIRFISCTARSVVFPEMVENRLPDERAALIPPELMININLVESTFDGQLESHGLLDLVAQRVIGAVAETVIGVELVDILTALLVDPNRRRVSGIEAHTRGVGSNRLNAAGRATA